MTSNDAVVKFLSGETFAVAGASTDRSKYGNKVLRCYLQHGRHVIPVHPKESEVEGQACYASVADIPVEVHGLSIITPPSITLKVVENALEAGVRNFWMQPGAEHPAAIQMAEEAGANVIHGGPCLLVVLGYRE
ncbi:MAG: putative CoA-binding protein [Planctomycetota bacterium]|jgi:predicted CoA-binding protein